MITEKKSKQSRGMGVATSETMAHQPIWPLTAFLLLLGGCAAVEDSSLARPPLDKDSPDASSESNLLDASVPDADAPSTATGDASTMTPDSMVTAPDAVVCQPRTCADVGAQCGTAGDGCGGQLSCGMCSAPQVCEDRICIAPFANTGRRQLNYVVVPHPDDEVGGWALIENSSANYNVFIHLTRGEKTGHCNESFSGYDHASEALPGDRADYRSQSCATLRMGSTLGFYRAMSNVDSYIGPIGEHEYKLRGTTLPAGTPGAGCAVSSTSFSIRPGQNSAIVFFDLGDGDLTRCEVEWAVSQVRALRGSPWLPQMPEWSLVGASFYNAVYEDCVVYTHGDHRAVHEALWHTDFGVRGPQYGRTCRSDPDQGRVDYVDQYYDLLGVNGDRRVGAAQVYYGWLWGGTWPTGTHDHVAAWSQNQAFWIRH